MSLVTLGLVVIGLAAVELVLGRVLPTLWSRPRWVILPLGGLLLGWTLPLSVMPSIPYAGEVLAALLCLIAALLIATFGHFRATFWTGPTEADIARTGRRSAIGTTVRVRHRP